MSEHSLLKYVCDKIALEHKPSRFSGDLCQRDASVSAD